MRAPWLYLFCAMLMSPAAMASDVRELNVMPLPAEYQLGAGRLVVDGSFTVALAGYRDARLELAVRRFRTSLSRQLGIELTPKMPEPAMAKLLIRVEHASKLLPELGEDESYALHVDSTQAQLTAPTTLGALHGLETFLQLVEATSQGFAAPEVTIRDRPRFPWRGLLIDTCRHFMPLTVIERNLDAMAAVKLNVLHLHLSEDQGFRVESRKFPKLHELGSDGLYYTQAEIRGLIAYAQDRGIRVVPEFDMPGHTSAWFVGYPELASAPGPYSIERNWGIFDPAMDPTREETYKFLDKFVGEMASLFPDRFFHVGGDEVNGKQWQANPKIQQFMAAHALKTSADLQAYFNKRLQEIVHKHGKTMVGWDEVLHPDVPKEIVVQSWRGPKSLAEAAQKGYRGILSSGFYLDHVQPAAVHYAVDPMGDAAATLTPEEKQRILGGEACMWAEYVGPETVDSRIWPRAAAIAERLWSPAEVRDVDSMYRRLSRTSARLEVAGAIHNTARQVMLRRIAGTADMAPLQVLTDVIEPVRGLARYSLHPEKRPNQNTPFNRIVDTIPPESLTARRFAREVDAAVSTGDRTTRNELRAQLSLWHGNDARLQPYLADSFLLQEIAPVSANLTAVSAIGLEALDYLEKNETAPDAWRTQQLALLETAKKPQGDVQLAIIDPVQKLVNAAAGVATPAAGAATSTQ